MRITKNMMMNTFLHDIQGSLARMDKLNSDMTGKRIKRPSDDPMGTSMVLKYQSDLTEIKQFKDNIDLAKGWMDVSESSVANVGDRLARLKELTVRAANGTFKNDDHYQFQTEVSEILKGLIAEGNTNYMGKYLFSGNEIDTPLFNDDGSYKVDVTDSELLQASTVSVLIGGNQKVKMTTHGTDIFGIDTKSNVYSQMIAGAGGILSTPDKIFISGHFDLNKSYAGETLSYKIGTETYEVSIGDLLGTPNMTLDKSVIVQKVRNATSTAIPGNTLAEVANVFFDDQNNLTVEVNKPATYAVDDYKAISSVMRSITTETGKASTTSSLRGNFELSGVNSNYAYLMGNDITITCSAYGGSEPEEYYLEKSGERNLSLLSGSIIPIKKSEIIDKIKNSKNAAGDSTLSDRYDVFFDADDKLVIKLRGTNPADYGDHTLSISTLPALVVPATAHGFAPTCEKGQAKAETTLNFTSFTFDNSYIVSHRDEIVKTPLHIDYMGQKRQINLDPNCVLTNADSYITELQKSLNGAFGDNHVKVSLAGTAPANYLKFETQNTPDGRMPSLKIEAVRSNTSTLIRDVQDLVKDLMVSNYKNISGFLDKLDGHINRVSAVRAEIGTKTNTLDLAKDRMEDSELTFGEMLSKVQYADYPETVMKFKMAESVYNAALMSGAKIIQPTLLDFLR